MPIPWRDLRVSVVSDAAWGNAKEAIWIENSEEDEWEETATHWIRHHRTERRTTFHPGASPGGPDLHDLLPERKTEFYFKRDGIMQHETCQDEWCDKNGIRVLQETSWRDKPPSRKHQKDRAPPRPRFIPASLSSSSSTAKAVKLSCTMTRNWQMTVSHV